MLASGVGYSSLPGTANTFCGILTASAVLGKTEQETIDLIWEGEGEEAQDLIRFSEVQRLVSLPSVRLVYLH